MHPQIKWILSQLPSGGPRSDARPVWPEPAHGLVTRMYVLKHTAATEVLEVLKKLESLRAVDFTRFAADPQTNSVITQATAEQQLGIQVALDALDQPAKQRSAAEGGAPAVAAAPAQDASVVYLTGTVARPGTYAVPSEGITVRRLLAASGGLGDGVKQVVVTRSRDGQSEVVCEIGGDDLRKPDGPDPAITAGQLVSVR